MSLPLFRREPAVIHGPLNIPTMPQRAVVDVAARFATAHDADCGAIAAACGLGVLDFTAITIGQARLFDVHWCDGCWPGHRCVICGLPSGEVNECAACLLYDIDAEKRLVA